jgi:signal peptidase I
VSAGAANGGRGLLTKTAPRARKSLTRDYAEGILIAVVAAFILRAFVAQAFKIPSGSMKPTLLVGDYIVVEKVAYIFRPPARGEVVVFKYPHQDNDVTVGRRFKELYDLVVHRHRVPRRDYVKRLIGLPGDVVQGKDGGVYVNGRPYHEPYVRGVSSGDFGPFKVPPNSYFVMGDSRGESRDSRHWGFVPRRLVKGRAVLIYWSWVPDFCLKHRSAVTRLYGVRLVGMDTDERPAPGEYICDAGGETLREGEDIRVTKWYEFWRHLRSDRLFLLVE